MSQESITDLAHRMAEAWNLGLYEYMALHAEDVVHVTTPEWHERGTYRGRDQVRRFWESISPDLGENEIAVDEVIVLDDHRVLSKLQWRVAGPTSGVETTSQVYIVATERDGLVARIEYFVNYETALEAAGLSK